MNPLTRQTLAGKMMKLLSFRQFDVIVRLPPWELCRRLLENVSGPSAFHGDVQEASFKIHRNVFWSDPFLPRLHGVFEAIEGGTRIQVKMKIQTLTKLYVLFFASVAVTLTLTGQLNYKVGLLILAFTISITYLGFWFNAKESKEAFLKFLEKDFAANQEDAPGQEAAR